MYITENMIKEIKLKCFQKFNISDLKFEFNNGEMDIRIEGLLGNLKNACTVSYKDGEVLDLKISGEKAETVIGKAHEIRGFIKKNNFSLGWRRMEKNHLFQYILWKKL